MTEPCLRVITKPHPTVPDASHFEITGDYQAVLDQVASIMNDELTQSATFDTVPRRVREVAGEVYRSEGTVTLWPVSSTTAAS